jgi:ankyrin repeat protein
VTPGGPDDSTAAFVAACQAGDAERVRALLAAHPELAPRINDSLPGFHFGGTALLAAVHSGTTALIELLLANGADINQKSRWWAGGFGVLDSDHDMVDFLIARGARVDACAAARHGMMDRLRALVAADPACVRMRGGDGQTPLHVAQTPEIAAFLLDHGAEIDALDVDHEGTPAQYAVRDRQDVVRLLIARGCRTDILMAAALGDPDLVRRFLDDDPDSVRVAVTDEYFPMRNPKAGGHIYRWTLDRNKTAHHMARMFGHADVERLLMEHTPAPLRLALACEFGDEAAVRVLRGAHPDLGRRLGPAEQRRLADAATDNNLEAVRLMLDAGWPVDARGDEDGTALHWAAFHGNAAMVRLLLGHGAPVDVTEASHGGRPLDWALYGSLHGWDRKQSDGYPAVVEALLDAGAQAPQTPDAGAASAAVRAVLERRRER